MEKIRGFEIARGWEDKEVNMPIRKTAKAAAYDLEAAEDNSNINPEGPLILAVTACPTGVAHTYMAKESLETKAKELNINLKVETDGSGGIKNELTDEEIKKAKAIIVAADAFVQMGRFNGRPVIEVPVSKAIGSPDVLLNSAVNDNIPKYKAGASEVFQMF